MRTARLRLRFVLPLVLVRGGRARSPSLRAPGTCRPHPGGRRAGRGQLVRSVAGSRTKPAPAETPVEPSDPVEPVTETAAAAGRVAAASTPLDAALEEHKVVVLVVYTPGAPLDELISPRGAPRRARRQRRLRRRQRGEGEDGRRARAHRYDVRDTPAVLVFRAGPGSAHCSSATPTATAVAQAAQTPAASRRTGRRAPGVEIDRRSARKDGREVGALRCVRPSRCGFVVECDVYPLDGLASRAARAPARTSSPKRRADAFIDEAEAGLIRLDKVLPGNARSDELPLDQDAAELFEGRQPRVTFASPSSHSVFMPAVACAARSISSRLACCGGEALERPRS